MVLKIKNKVKREQVFRKQRREHTQAKLNQRVERAALEKKDPALRARRLAENVPRTQDNMREAYEPHRESEADDQPAASTSKLPDSDSDEDDDQQPRTPSCKVLVTTSPKVTRATYDFCEELVAVFPDSEFVRRLRKSRAFSIGNIANWASKRGYTSLIVVNEDRKVPNAITLVQLPDGPTAYFKLTSIELTKQIFGHARASPHHPELILNGFVTTLGHTVGKMFQTLFPPLPEFEGRQVVTLHNQRDFLFFRRHRYAFRSTEKVALQEIGPRFTLKLKWLKKGLPTARMKEKEEKTEVDGTAETSTEESAAKVELKPTGTGTGVDDGYEWMWKKELETSRRTFFL
ncbi:Brix-domain-containing protein [Exidia glandulosa HHB12029]|uniref:Brix-domain-containing protein n=1 Tax=Exidia glandulosa HHB12029 TaxID=1314781 RepID=A0A165N0J1_EXIGL|nr:Brix-domain-containing protein [Exidia glandulosa HHB12029]